MPNIVIKEVDATSAGRNAASTDVVFVPGFADTNANVYILTKPGETPNSKSLAATAWTSEDDPTRKDFNTHLGGEDHANPQFAVNTTDKLMWQGSTTSQQILTKTGSLQIPTGSSISATTSISYQGSLLDSGNGSNKISVDLLSVEKSTGEATIPAANNQNVSLTGTDPSKQITIKWEDESGDHSFTCAPDSTDKTFTIYNAATEVDQSIYGTVNFEGETISIGVTYSGDSASDTSIEWEQEGVSTATQVLLDTSNKVVNAVSNKIRVSYENVAGSGVSNTLSLSLVITDPTLDISRANYSFNYRGISWIESTKNNTPLYFEPYSENTPVLCSTIAQFEENFGTKPYVWQPEGSETETGEAYSNRRIFPEFSDKATPTNPFYAYKTGDKEKSYVYAAELINAGLPVLYYNVVRRITEDTVSDTISPKTFPSVSDLYSMLPDALEEITDKSEYSVKYITSGGYPTYELRNTSEGSLSDKMQATAEARGDAVAIIDHTNNPVRPIQGPGSVYETLGTPSYLSTDSREYSTMFTPWYTYTCTKTDVSNFAMPASYGYLMALAKSIVNNANWLAIAGVSRGLVPKYIAPLTTTKITNKIADTVYQPRNAVALNAITNIKPYGDCIWGNRTLITNSKGNLTAHSFLNVRNLVSDIKKQVYTTAKRLIFEQNSDVLWINFIAGISPLLDQMVSGQGIKGYKIIKGTTDEKAKVVAQIRITPIYPVEDFDITIVLTDDEVSVS